MLKHKLILKIKEKDAWNNNQGTNKTFSLTGSDYGVPATSELWSTEENNCGIAIALDSLPANGYYFAVAHEYAQDDFNCETGDICMKYAQNRILILTNLCE